MKSPTMRLIKCSVICLLAMAESHAATQVLGELSTIVSGDFQYGPVPGAFIVDLTGVPAVAGSNAQKFVKIANDFKAAGDTPAQMPDFQVRLERKASAAGAFTTADTRELAHFTGINSNLYNVRLEPDPAAGGGFATEAIYTITITLPDGGWAASQPAGAGERLVIGIRNNSASPRTYFGVLGETENEARAAKIKLVSDPIDFGEVLVGSLAADVATEHLVFANVGTGDLNIPAGGFPQPANLAFTRSPLTLAANLAPMVSMDVEIYFNPAHPTVISATPGPMATAAVITSNSSVTPILNVPISATPVKLEVGFLYDISGSMRLTPAGNQTSTKEDTRLYQAKQAGNQIRTILLGLEGDALMAGLFTLPDVSGSCPSAGTRIPMVSIKNTEFERAWGHGIDGLEPDGTTPMAEGLNKAHGVVPGNFGGGKWTRGPYVRRALLMLSDGYNECNSSPPRATPVEWIAYLKTITDPKDKIRIMTIPYGDPNGFGVDRNTLEQIGKASGGDMYMANAMDFEELGKQFRNALIDWKSDWANIKDPVGSLTKGGPVQSHDVCIDEKVNKISFVVDWEKPAANALNFSLIGPNGAVTSATPGVTFHSSHNFAIFNVKGSAAKGNPGSDQWTFKLTGGAGLTQGETLKYNYSVTGKTKVKPVPITNLGILATLDNPFYEVKISHMVDSLPPPKVWIKYSLPKQSYGTYISSMEGFNPEWIRLGASEPESDTTPPAPGIARSAVKMGLGFKEEIARLGYVPEKLMGETISLVQRKALAMEVLAKRPFDIEKDTGEIPLFDDGSHGDRVARDGIFSNNLPRFTHDGFARFGLFMERAGSCLTRETWFDKGIRVKLDKMAMSNQIKLMEIATTPFYPARLLELLKTPVPEGSKRKDVRFQPKDSLGNFWGPGNLANLGFTVQNAEKIGEPVDNLDGSYTQVIEYQKSANPMVSVTAEGTTSNEISVDPIQPPFKFKWWMVLILILIAITFTILRRKK